MNTSLVWKARPIFLLSTFRDLGAERDFLRANTFLRLGEQVRERCHYLDTIDLCQGVETASEADDAKGWWRKAYEQLSGMKRGGIVLSTDEQYLETLRRKVNA